MSYHFQSDISHETLLACFEALDRNAPKELSNQEHYWPLFKKWFANTVSPLVSEYDLSGLMDMVAVENLQPYIGSILAYGIRLYFDPNITSYFSRSGDCLLYAKMNEELSAINGFDKVVLMEEFSEKLDGYSWNELIDQIEILSYYYPSFVDLANVICCTKIPRNQLANFLRFANYYTPVEGYANLLSASTNDIKLAYERFIDFNIKSSKNCKNREAFIADKTKAKSNGGQHKAKEKGKLRRRKQ